jgi:hypothetical protein
MFSIHGLRDEKKVRELAPDTPLRIERSDSVSPAALMGRRWRSQLSSDRDRDTPRRNTLDAYAVDDDVTDGLSGALYADAA